MTTKSPCTDVAEYPSVEFGFVLVFHTLLDFTSSCDLYQSEYWRNPLSALEAERQQSLAVDRVKG